MKLYDIVEELEKAYDEMVDPETGEINEEIYKRFNDLKLDLKSKIENIALYIKNTNADIAALKKEEESFKARRKSAESKTKWLANYLAMFLEQHNMDDGFESEKCKVTFRKSKSTEIKDEDKFYKFFDKKENKELKELVIKVTTEQTVDKKKLKEILDSGIEIPGAEISNNKNISVK